MTVQRPEGLSDPDKQEIPYEEALHDDAEAETRASEADAEDDAWFPLVLRLGGGARALVVGGGAIGANKTALLVAARAHVVVLAPELCPELARLHRDGRIEHVAQAVSETLLESLLPGARVVFAATDDRSVNRAVARIAGAANIPVCAVDDPEASTFITPAIVRRGPVQVAISTSGAAPVLARRLREKIEAMLPGRLDALARFMRARRPEMNAIHPGADTRRRVWEAFLDGPGAEQALAGQEDLATQTLERLARGQGERMGEVWLVGAGPGDPDMLTLGALRLMQNADSVLYDRLLPPEILERVRRDAERIFVGKARSDHVLPQDQINEELVRRARAGERVLRLKGGDPFIFGRGGEEVEALMAAGVPFRILPGVSAANGCAATAGIPLTHRDCAQSCLFLTGHARADGELDLPWDTIARHGQTVVIYMGLGGLASLSAQLQTHGLPANWPAALVENGTRPEQRVIAGDLATLPAKAITENVKSPALIIVGEVVRHRVISPRGESSRAS
ncbi:uroporphyrinogen-III C-methyltransferase [Acetobacter sacchari]|uniref:Uroporphyrinogen-III C-methyltransferase n=1 Tax=Acetobacter sacchari TaxID=2661687 RepID=A0ABS3LYJ7_9PROT|nr:siroheme synthase CysG [Acetobacter sacchari]MBO1360966.1 uroporphyrinogen-III C-methyltransferase [Acetobacter sacchari]